MAVYTKRAAEIFAPTTGGGAPRGADMGEVQRWGTEVEEASGGQLFTPLQHEAVGDGVADDGAEINVMTEAARDTLSDSTFIGDMNLANRRYRTTISLDLTGMRTGYGKYFGNGVILSEAEDKAALDFTFSLGLPVYRIVVRGSEDAPPIVGGLWARPAAGTPSSEHSVRDSAFTGHYGLTAGLNYASETFTYDRVIFENESRDAGAYALMLTAHSLALGSVQSDFEPIASGERSFIMGSTRNVKVSRTSSTDFIITNITNANPPVATFTGTAPTNGTEFLYRPTSGMESLEDVVLTVANVTATTFQISGKNTTSDGAYGGGSAFYRTGTPIYMGGPLQAHYHENIYGQAWGAPGTVLENSGSGIQVRALHIKGHWEGSAISSLLHFKTGAVTYEATDLRLLEHNNQCVGSILSTDANIDAYVKLNDARISVLGLNETPANQLFDSTRRYQFNGKSVLQVPSGLLANNELCQVLRLPNEVIVYDAAWPVRRYNFERSPAHIQILDNCSSLFATVSGATVARNNGWIDRVGSVGGSITAADGANTTTYVTFATGTNNDMSDSGFKRRGPRIFRPSSGDMQFEFVFAVPNITQLAWTIGFEAASTTAALADTDVVATLNSSDVPTVTANDACGIMHDPTGTTDLIYAFNRRAGGTAAVTSTGITPVLSTKYWFRIHVNLVGNMFVFYSTDGINFTRVALVTTAVTAAENYAPVVAGLTKSGTTSRELDLYAANAICLRV